MADTSELSVQSLTSEEINKIEQFRRSRHTAVLAILFSDIVNSTFATERLGEQLYARLRHIHDELFTRIMCRDNAGIIIKQIGDSFLCVFAEPSTAVIRAIEFQRAIHSNNANLTDRNYTLTVRIGIHVGQVAVENAIAMDIFGRHVNRAQRIEAIGNSGHVLTSQSVWENAIGLIENNVEQNIGYISYGKTRLRGIAGKIQIYGFYPNELGKPAHPKTIRKQKRTRAIMLLAIFALITASSLIIFKSLNKAVPVSTAARNVYYIQFDFSALAKYPNILQNLNIDTAALSDRLLSQVITILNADSVVTEADLIRLFSKKGKLYRRHYPDSAGTATPKFFKDSLNLSRLISIKALSGSKQKNDSLELQMALIYADTNSVNSAFNSEVLSLGNIENDFRRFLQDELVDMTLFPEQGYVMSVNDSILLFRLAKDSKLREGALITFFHVYAGKEGVRQRLNDIKAQIEFFSEKPQDSLLLKSCREEYAEVEKNMSYGDFGGSMSYSIGITGKVIELYDTTGKATWRVTGEFLNEKPRQGDEISLEY